MGLRDSGAGPAGGAARGGVAIGLALAMLLVPFTATTAGADHGDLGVSLEPWMADCDFEDWLGFQGRYGFAHYRVCFSVEADTPDYAYGLLDHVQIPPNLQRTGCPGGFHGQIFEIGQTRAGLCFEVVHTVPQNPWPIHVNVDLSSCEVPGPEEGEDPAILVFDGGVGICLVPVFEPGPGTPDAGVSPEPCEPRTVDPEVRFGGGRVEVCMDVFLLAVGSEDVNRYVQRTNETAHETVEVVEDFVGLNDTAS